MLKYNNFILESETEPKEKLNHYAKFWGDLTDEEHDKIKKVLTDSFKSYEIDEEGNENYAYLTFYKGEELQGILEYGFYPADDDSDEEYNHISFIVSLVKRQGVGEYLVKCLLHYWPDKIIRCFVKKVNEPSLKMFKKIGFKVLGQCKCYEDSYVLEYRP